MENEHKKLLDVEGSKSTKKNDASNHRSLKEKVGNVSDTDNDKIKETIEAKKGAKTLEQVHADGLDGYYKLRKWWSGFLLGWISFLIVSHTALTWCIGIGWLDYSDHKVLVNILAAETFLQIVALGLIAVKFLFSDNDKMKT